MTTDHAPEPLSLLDWRRTIGDLYADIRAEPDKQAAWRRWQATRSRLFREHSQSPVPSRSAATTRARTYSTMTRPGA